MTAATLALGSLFLLNSSLGCPIDYFQRGLFHNDPRWDSSTAQTVQEYLVAAGEPPLLEGTSGAETYRLTWLPNFDRAILVRIATSGGTEARIVRFNGLSPEEGIVIRTVQLSCDEWEMVRSHVRDSGFWQEMENHPIPKDQVVLDGSLWILEGTREDNYKAVQRVFPRIEREQDVKFMQLSLTIMRIVGIEVEEHDVY